MVYPALIPTTKKYDMLASSMVSRELRSKIRQFRQHCFRTTLNFLLTQWFQSFPVIWYTICYICQLQLGWYLVAVVQYTLIHKQNIERPKEHRKHK